MPAMNGLALYYFEQARRRAGAKRGHRPPNGPASPRLLKTADVQQLELAALVCSQAIAKAPRYAPIHNTAGLIQNELGHVNKAVAEFARAAELDPNSFEALMNYASINLGFRGFEQAEAAYRRAIALRPNDYDAHLGLAVALRGAIIDEPDEKAHRAKIDRVLSELAVAKKIDGNRPDAFYNEGIVLHELMSSRETPEASIAALDRAEATFRTFLEKAKGKPDYDSAVTRAGDRLTDINATRDFLRTAPRKVP
jgi:tetratricopeptide (TPR) repeat protein